MTSSDDEATLMAKLTALRAQYRLAVAAGDERNAAELRQRIYETSAQLWQARRNAQHTQRLSRTGRREEVTG